MHCAVIHSVAYAEERYLISREGDEREACFTFSIFTFDEKIGVCLIMKDAFWQISLGAGWGFSGGRES